MMSTRKLIFEITTEEKTIPKMGADGWIKIYDADAIDNAGFGEQMYDIFANVTKIKLFEHNIYIIYGDTELRNEKNYGTTFEECDEFRDKIGDFLLEDVTVWS